MEKGKHFDDGKLPLESINPYVEEALASVLQYGSKKYGLYNWRGGIAWSRVFGSLRRHLHEWYKGIEIDSESGLPHLSHALANLSFLIEYSQTHKNLDDRPFVKKGR